MALALDIRDLARSGTQLKEERENPVRIAIFIEVDAPDELVDLVQSRFHPQTAGARLHREVAEPGTKLVVDPSADAVVAIAGGAGDSLAGSLADARNRAVPAILLGVGEDPSSLAERLGHSYRDTFADPDIYRLVDVELGEWLVDRVSDKQLALANNFVFMRRAVAIERVKNTAVQNALIGGVVIIPGADMPLMTANQSKMVLQIAAAYGEHLGAERIRELLGVLGGAFALRTVARQAVAFVPGFGWAIKAGIGYTGTIGMGFAAIKYFENDADLGDIQRRLEEYGKQIAGRVRSLSRSERAAQQKALTEGTEAPVLDVLPPEPDVPAQETMPGEQ